MRYQSSGLLAPEKNLRDNIQNQMSVTPYSNGQLANNTRRSWISLTAFNSDFFSYTTTVNPTTFQTTGSLGAVTSATSVTCPTARILRENGKKLYPSAHNGVNTYMVGVFDPVSFLSGYIDPNNSSVFAVYNADKPASLDTSLLAGGVNPNGGAADVSEIVSVGQVRSSTVVPLTSAATVNINMALGQTFTITPAENINFTVSNLVAGGTCTLIILTSGTNSYNMTFTGGVIYDAGTLATGTTSARVFTISFISNGTNLFETSRTAVQAL